MKKLLLGAFLIAGTTLAFAKDNVKSTTSNLKIEKTVSLEKVIPSSDKEVASVKNICHSTAFTSDTHPVTSIGMDGSTHVSYETTTTFYTYWYGC